MTFSPVNSSNFSAFKDLLLEQAIAQGGRYRGNDNNLQATLIDPQKPVFAFMAQDPQSTEALGYILYNIHYSARGKEIYMEDLLVRSTTRSKGTGSKLFNELKDIAKAQNAIAIRWIAGKNNIVARQFYEKRHTASASLHHSAFDIPVPSITSCFQRHGNGTCRVVEATNDNISLYNDTLPDKVRPAFISAAHDPNTTFLLTAEHDTNRPIKGMIAHLNYSSFATEFGYDIELIDFNADNTAEYHIDDFNACLTALRDKPTPYHINHAHITIDNNSPAQLKFAQDNAWSPLTINTSPESEAIIYRLPCQRQSLA